MIGISIIQKNPNPGVGTWKLCFKVYNQDISFYNFFMVWKDFLMNVHVSMLQNKYRYLWCNLWWAFYNVCVNVSLVSYMYLIKNDFFNPLYMFEGTRISGIAIGGAQFWKMSTMYFRHFAIIFLGCGPWFENKFEFSFTRRYFVLGAQKRNAL